MVLLSVTTAQFDPRVLVTSLTLFSCYSGDNVGFLNSDPFLEKVGHSGSQRGKGNCG